MRAILPTALLPAILVIAALEIRAQNIFVYDQQSATEDTGGGAASSIQPFQPLGQSFQPSLSSVGFIRLNLGDRTSGNGLGATLRIDLHSVSITGPILGSTESVVLPDGFHGFPDFFFPTPVAVTSGSTYYFQPVVESGDSWAIITYGYNYSGGTAIAQGVPNVNLDLWFREGIVVPEPSSVALLVLGGAVWVCVRRNLHPPPVANRRVAP